MNKLTINKVKQIIADSVYKDSFKKRLGFSDRALLELLDYELIPIFDNKGNGFVLLHDAATNTYEIVRFESTQIKANFATGRQKPIICDLCFTWQSGNSISRVAFFSQVKGGRAISLLCCKNLTCSLNARKLTDASILSQAQLRESLDELDRIKRLRDHYTELILQALEFQGAPGAKWIGSV